MNFSLAYSLLIFLITLPQLSFACSMYKVTFEGVTKVGCNEDNWRPNSRIWFENATKDQKYGAAFSGSRIRYDEVFAAQSGMNTMGLVFSRLASFHPVQKAKDSGEKRISNPDQFLINILHEAADVHQVKAIFDLYDQSVFIDDVIIYVDSNGKVLVVEPYTTILIDQPYYVLSNFCPSITSKDYARKLIRYRNGDDLLSSKIDSSFEFCRMVSDTMHVCRDRLGDGTLLTTIWAPNNGYFDAFFYHDYSQSKRFFLEEELASGDHMVDVTKLFNENSEFVTMVNTITPFNNDALRGIMAIWGGVLLIIGLAILLKSLLSALRREGQGFFSLFGLMGVLLFFHLLVLTTNIGIYYFDAPYVDLSSKWVTMASYIPILNLVSLPILISTYINSLKKQETSNGLKYLIAFVLVSMMIVGGMDFYWGLIAY